MGKVNFSEEEQKVLSERFGCIYEYTKKIDSYKEEIKQLNASISETMKDLVERMQSDKKTISSAYKEFVFAVKEPELYQDKENIKEFLLEHKKTIAD